MTRSTMAAAAAAAALGPTHKDTPFTGPGHKDETRTAINNKTLILLMITKLNIGSI